VGDQPHASVALHSGIARYLLYRWLGGTQGGLDGYEKSRLPPGFDPRTTQPVTSPVVALRTTRFLTLNKTANVDISLILRRIHEIIVAVDNYKYYIL